MNQYKEAPEVKTIAQEVITTLPLDENVPKVKMAYLFLLRKKSTFKAQIQRPGGAWVFLSDYDFVMLIHKDSWDAITEHQRKALVYHELLHITHTKKKDGKIVLKLRRHDVEDFIEVVKHFGNWSLELEALNNVKTETSEHRKRGDE